ncbi:MAG: TIGR03663 family protein, partial [Anaerolineae bacterium]|nr:TIGR03663 family protein [Anaerolineae bacterium]
MATIEQVPPGESVSPLNRFLARTQVMNWELIIYLVIFLLAVFTRFYVLGDRVMSHDESLHTRYSYNLYADGNFQHTPLMHGPILFHITAFFYFLFGDNDFTARLYPAILGIAVVMMPFLFRRWLGRIGALLASLMLLISPIMLYYNRYIRHDTPSIFFALLMLYSIMMYISGPPERRHKTYWLFLLAGAMIGNLGSKETSFIYIAIFGSFLTLYWLARMAQHFWRMPGKTLFYFVTIGILLAGVAALGMYVVLSIAPLDRAIQSSQISGGWLNNLDSSSFILWTVGVIAVVLAVLFGTLLWAFRASSVRIRWRDVLVIVLIAIVVSSGLILIEELSHVQAANSSETVEPAVPGEDAAALGLSVAALPLILAWVGGAVVVLGVLASWRLGWWNLLHRFPELDVLIVMGTLILPWATPFIIKAMGVSPTDYSSEGITRAILAIIPMIAISVVVGLVWNWRAWLVCAVLFYAIFAFFFTTMFTNPNGLATGVIGSLGYWIEQQGVRRGSQPQYYYLLLIMPFYEFLPVIGSVLAMFGGMGLFWRYRRVDLAAQAENYALDIQAAELGTRDLEEETPAIGDLIGDDPDVRPEPELESKPKNEDRAAGLDHVPFLLFVSWWSILNLIGYTLAGEKMPWLGTHLTLPLILLSGWYFGGVFEKINWRRFLKAGWLY